jgi:alpha-1,6-mannosyltransferase
MTTIVASGADDTPAPRWGLCCLTTGLLVVAAVSVARAWLAGTLRVDDAPLSPLAIGAISAAFAAGVLLVALGHVRCLASATVGRGPTLRAAVALQLLAACALPLTSNDLFNNLLYGHLVAHQAQSPYTASPARLLAHPFQPWIGRLWKTTPCEYGPPLVGVATLASLAGGDGMPLNVVAFKVVMLLIGLGAILLAWRVLPDGARRWFVIASPVWLLEVLGQAHNDGVVVLLLLAAMLALRRGSDLLCAALLGLGAAAKYVPALPLALLMLWTIWLGRGAWPRRLGRAAAQGLIAVAVAVATYLPIWQGWETLRRPLIALGTPKFHYSLLKLLRLGVLSWGGEREALLALRVTQGLFAALLLVAACWWIRRWRERPGDPDVVWSTAGRLLLLHTLLLNSHFMPWYLAWTLPLLAVEHDRRWWTVVIVYSTLTQLHYGLDWTLPWDPKQIVNVLLIHLAPAVLLLLLLRRRPLVHRDSPLRSLALIEASGAALCAREER